MENEAFGSEIIKMSIDLQAATKTCAELGRFKDKQEYMRVATCIETIYSTTRALQAAAILKPEGFLDPNHYLKIFGFLQVVSVQQDALINLGQCVGVEIDVGQTPAIENARKIRRFVTGHPTETNLKGRKAFTVINSSSLQSHSFDFETYFSDGVSVKETVFPAQVISEQLKFCFEKMRELSVCLVSQGKS